jgi:hypothetical protein
MTMKIAEVIAECTFETFQKENVYLDTRKNHRPQRSTPFKNDNSKIRISLVALCEFTFLNTKRRIYEIQAMKTIY